MVLKCFYLIKKSSYIYNFNNFFPYPMLNITFTFIEWYCTIYERLYELIDTTCNKNNTQSIPMVEAMLLD